MERFPIYLRSNVDKNEFSGVEILCEVCFRNIISNTYILASSWLFYISNVFQLWGSTNEESSHFGYESISGWSPRIHDNVMGTSFVRYRDVTVTFRSESFPLIHGQHFQE